MSCRIEWGPLPFGQANIPPLVAVGGATGAVGDATKGVGNTANDATKGVGDTASGATEGIGGKKHDAQNPLGL